MSKYIFIVKILNSDTKVSKSLFTSKSAEVTIASLYAVRNALIVGNVDLAKVKVQLVVHEISGNKTNSYIKNVLMMNELTRIISDSFVIGERKETVIANHEC